MLLQIFVYALILINSLVSLFPESFFVKPEKISPNLVFEHYSLNNGLPDERIRYIFQASNRFLWIGTMNGLSRYDGYQFKNYYKSESANSIPGNWITSITEDKYNRLWIGTTHGISKFDTSTERFVNYKISGRNNAVNDKINSLQFDNNGKLWVGTSQGLFVLDTASSKLTYIKSKELNYPTGKIIKSYGNYLWVANNQGVIHINSNTYKYKAYPIKLKESYYGDVIWGLLENDKNLFLATAKDGLLILPFDKKKSTYTGYKRFNTFKNSSVNLENLELFDIQRSKDGAIWLATSDGLAKLTSSPNNTISFNKNNSQNSKSLSNDIVYSILIDKDDIMWCGTLMGLNKLALNNLVFRYYTFSSVRDQVRTIFVDKANVWMGTNRSGIVKLNIITGTSQRLYSNLAEYNAHRSLLVDKTGYVWMGTINGLTKVNSQTLNVINTLKNATTYALLEDSKGNLWQGTTNGLFFKPLVGQIYKVGLHKNGKKISGRNNIRSLLEDHHGNIWIGFENDGLGYIDEKTKEFISVKGKNSFIGGSIYSLAESIDHSIWAGSESGLNQIILKKTNTKQEIEVKSFTDKDGLPDKAVNGILTDKLGNIWVSSIKGLGKYDIKNKTWQNYLPETSFNYNSCFSKYGKFYFGITDGFLMFDPLVIIENENKPQVVLSGLKLFNNDVLIGEKINGDVILKEAIANTSSILLNYKNNVFTLSFTGLHFTNPAKNKYEYILEGFNKDWISTDANNRSATYTNLNPGTYKFKVRAASSFGKWSKDEKVIEITILPPPWMSWWALTFYLIITVVIIIIGYRYFMERARERQNLRLERIEKEQIKKLNELKMNFFTDISHEFRTPLSLIIGPAEDLLISPDLNEELKNQLKSIKRNSKKLNHLIDELLTFQKLNEDKLILNYTEIDFKSFINEIYLTFKIAADKKQIQLNLFVESENINLCADISKLEIILNNILFNALKFTNPFGKIDILVSQFTDSDLPIFDDINDKNALAIQIRDDGKGIPEEEMQHLFERFFQSKSSRIGTGVGLSLTKSLVELHGGKISVESKPDVETSFNIILPLLNITKHNLNISEISSNHDLNVVSLDSLEELIVSQDASIMLTVDKGLRDLRFSLLIVDDNEEILNYLEQVFKEEYVIFRATDGKKALAVMSSVEPDLIISDVMMPEMDGIELCKIIKNNVESSHIPMILLTAKSDIQNKIDGFQVGADDYIPKPFNSHLLKARVDNLITGRLKLIEKFKTSEVIIPKEITRNPLDEKFIEKVLNSINIHISNEEFNVEELGSSVAMSRSNLFRKVKAITGQTPIELIHNIRLKKGMEMLLNREHNVSEISYKVGFKSPTAFSKSFKKKYGNTPMYYLNNAIAIKSKVNNLA